MLWPKSCCTLANKIKTAKKIIGRKIFAHKKKLFQGWIRKTLSFLGKKRIHEKFPNNRTIHHLLKRRPFIGHMTINKKWSALEKTFLT
jgi:hypothetical protein